MTASISDMPERERPLSEQFRVVAKRFVDADAAATILEETKSAVLSQKQLALGDMPVSRSEMIVKGSAEWHEHIERIVAARAAANVLKLQLDYIRMKERELDRADWAQRSERKMMRNAT